MEARTLSVSIGCEPRRVYDFVSDPRNLPLWASGLCKSIRQVNAEWIAETAAGPATIRFAARNELGVLDHYVRPAPGVEIYVPMRVMANGSGSEVLFTLLRLPDVSDENFSEDIGLVERDLNSLKRALETR